MEKNYKIAILGAGNVGWHLAQDLEKAGHTIMEVYSRDVNSAKRLCKFLYDSNPTSKLNFTKSYAEVFLLAVSDDAISEVIEKIVLPENAIIAHTSGTVGMNVLESFSNTG